MELHHYITSVDKFKDSAIWAFHIDVPLEIAECLNKPNRRVLCSINDTPPFHAALMHDGQGGYFINLNKQLMKKNHLREQDEIRVTLEKDNSKYGIFTPDFFEELCYQDPEASDFFHALTIGKQRSLLHIIGKLKSKQKQLEKALIVFDYLKSSNGELDYRALNEAFKNSRFKT